MKQKLAVLNKIMTGVMLGIMIIVILFAFLIIVMALYIGLTERPPYHKHLMTDEVKLECEGNDIQALIGEVEELLQYDEKGWDLRRADARWIQNGIDTIGYSTIYMYYRPKDDTGSLYQRIRLFNENDGWYITEAYELDGQEEYVYMEKSIGVPALEEILESAKRQILLYCPECDEWGVSVTSENASVNVYRVDDKGEIYIMEDMAFEVRETENGYQLANPRGHSNLYKRQDRQHKISVSRKESRERPAIQ